MKYNYFGRLKLVIFHKSVEKYVFVYYITFCIDKYKNLNFIKCPPIKLHMNKAYWLLLQG